MKFKVKVRCSLEVELTMGPYDSWPEDEREVIELIKFQIQENSCPGTGVVGAEIERVQKQCEEGGSKSRICWACVLNGENIVTELERIE